jgi:xanthine dehydrogenase iron-sulfur cluster and FAD-binding subunit A
VKPAPFVYHEPRTVAEACELLATREKLRVLAGGQSLLALLNFRAVAPDHLVDLNRIDELSYLRASDDVLEIGAMTRQRGIERSAEIGRRCPLLHEALAHVGHVQTRNRGTLGGSLCHLDASAELVNIAALLDAKLHAVSRRGRRDIPFPEFAAGYLTTSLAPDEILAGVTLPLPPARHGYAFVEFARRRVDFAIVACTARLTLDDRGDIAHAALALSGLDHAPVRPAAIEHALRGRQPVAETFKAAASAAGALDAHSDPFVSSAYRKHLARILTYRVLEQAVARARRHESPGQGGRREPTGLGAQRAGDGPQGESAPDTESSAARLDRGLEDHPIAGIDRKSNCGQAADSSVHATRGRFGAGSIADTKTIGVSVNGKSWTGEVETRLTLADFLRHELQLTGTHIGCEHGVCGACTVLVDGASARSCLMLAVQCDGAHITTVESLARGEGLNVLQQAFRDCHGLQCGFCTPGMLMTLTEFLRDHADPSEAQVRDVLSGNLCRCTGYQGIVDAALAAAKRMREDRR